MYAHQLTLLTREKKGAGIIKVNRTYLAKEGET